MLYWMNGSFFEAAELKVSPLSHGAFYGVSAMEVFRTYKGKAVFFQDHYTQLCEHMKMYRMTMPYTIKELEHVITQLNAQDGRDGAFCIQVSAMEPKIFMPVMEYTELQVLILREPAKPLAQFEKEAIWLQTVYKSESPSTRIRAGFEVPTFERFEGFLTTTRDVIAEGVTSSIFWAKNDILYTPSLRVGIRPTVIRQTIIQLAQVMGYNVQEDFYLKYELEEAHECFIVNSLEEIVPITRIGHAAFAGREGLVYERLYHAYGHEISQRLRRG